eukprot:1554540-Prymnesium_polylepis.1
MPSYSAVEKQTWSQSSSFCGSAGRNVDFDSFSVHHNILYACLFVSFPLRLNVVTRSFLGCDQSLKRAGRLRGRDA